MNAEQFARIVDIASEAALAAQRSLDGHSVMSLTSGDDRPVREAFAAAVISEVSAAAPAPPDADCAECFGSGCALCAGKEGA